MMARWQKKMKPRPQGGQGAKKKKPVCPPQGQTGQEEGKISTNHDGVPPDNTERRVIKIELGRVFFSFLFPQLLD